MGVVSLVSDGMGSDEYLTHEQRENDPTIEPGQIRVVECEPASLSAFHAELLTRANVVLYERALLAAVAEALPIGVYAEPLPPDRSERDRRSRGARWNLPPTAGASCNWSKGASDGVSCCAL